MLIDGQGIIQIAVLSRHDEVAVGLVVGRPHVLVVEPDDGFSQAEMLADVFLDLRLIGVRTVVVEGQLGFGCGLDGTFQDLHGEDTSPFLHDGHKKKGHQQGKQDTIISNPTPILLISFGIFALKVNGLLDIG